MKMMSENIQVIFYGQVSQDWKDSFYPDSPIWNQIPEVKQVLATNYPKVVRDSSFSKQVVIPLLPDHSKTCPKGYFSLIPPDESVDICANKKKFIDFLIANDLSDYCSRQYEKDSVEYPAIIKTPTDSGGKNIRIVQNEEEFVRLINSDIYKNKDFYVEEYIHGNVEHVVNVICKDGKILWSFGHEYYRPEEYYVKHGVQGQSSFYTPPQEFLNIFEHIMGLLNYSGPCNFGYKVKDGKPKIFEVNPRFGSGLVVPKAHKPYFIESLRVLIANSIVTDE